MGYADMSRKVIDSYEALVEMVDDREPADVHNMDAGRLTERIEPNTIEAAVVDPPYYDSIMYAQLSDVFYVLQKEYLSEIHPEFYDSVLTNKQDEAVADPSRFDGISGDKSKKQMAKQDYEDKMSGIFNELHEVIEPGGVLTIMFTHKETDAWDTLSMSLIDAGFTITATHPITSEMPNRAVVRGANSADSTILLTGRKPTTESDDDGSTSLWEQVRVETKREAKKAARELLNSGLSLTRTDTIIAAFGPTLKVYSDNYPVVNKKGDHVPPREALAEARDAVVQVFSDRYLETDRFDNLDNLTRWYILSWLVYETDTFPYDEGLQLGMGVGVDIDEVKRETKIWGKKSGDIQLKGHSDRVQDIVRIEAGEDVSQRKYPVDPTKERFSHMIDTVQSAIHVYENKGPDAAWDWLTERNLKNEQRFETTIKALLEVLPPQDKTANTLLDMVSGKTGEYLDIDISTLNLNVEQDDEGTEQTGVNDFK
jgi:adenine-specific DNA methylase